MVVYGPYYAGSVSGNSETEIEWTDPENARGMEDEAYANCFFSSKNTCSIPLMAYDFNIAIPAKETIVGIKVEVLKSSDRAGIVFDKEGESLGAMLFLDAENISSYVGVDLARGDSWPVGDFEWISYGGENDLWGTSDLAAENLNTERFGFGISAFSKQEGYSAMVDAIRITIYLDDPAVVFTISTPDSPLGGSSWGQVSPAAPHAGATGPQRPSAPHAGATGPQRPSAPH